MPDAIQCPLQRPCWVALTGLAVCLAGLAGLAGLLYGLPVSYLVTIALLLLWRFMRRRNAKPFRPVGPLTLSSEGVWHIQGSADAAAQPLSLVHAWPAFAWITLRFDRGAAINSKDTMLEVTLWKSGVAPDTWRRLRVHIARQIASPEPAVARGSY
jgi:hypothetical protein